MVYFFVFLHRYTSLSSHLFTQGLCHKPLKMDSPEKTFVALKPYKSEAPEELTLSVGSILEKSRPVEGGWFEGYLSDKKGIFLSLFCRELPTFTLLERIQQVSLHSYEATHPCGISLEKGQIITRLGHTWTGWSLGLTDKGEVGDYPSEYAVDRQPGDTDLWTRIIAFDYSTTRTDEIDVKKGDRVQIIPDKETS